MDKYLSSVLRGNPKTQGGYIRAILDEEHTPPPHLTHLYTYRERGCYARFCACTGACKDMGWYNKHGHRYWTRKQEALIKKKARKTTKAIARRFKGYRLWSQRNNLCLKSQL